MMKTWCCLFAIFLLNAFPSSHSHADERTLEEIITSLSSYKDRSTGGEGYNKAVDFITEYLQDLGLNPKVHQYPLPVRKVVSSTLTIKNKSFPLRPFFYNAITPQSTGEPLSAPVVYVKNGSFQSLRGKQVKDRIILMDFDSGKNWLETASLGAKALIYINRKGITNKFFFKEKLELTPIQFPIFWIEEEEARHFFEDFDGLSDGVTQEVTITSDIRWQQIYAKNIYATIEGADPELKDELLVVESFFDNQAYLPGMGPGADEAVSAATLLKTASYLSQNRPGRSVLITATSGHAQTLAGFREFIWSFSSPSKERREFKKQLRKTIKDAKQHRDTLSTLQLPLNPDQERDRKISNAIGNQLKSKVDTLSRELVQLRLDDSGNKNKEKIDALVEQRFALRRLGWAEDYSNLTEKENELLESLLPEAIAEQKKTITDTEKQSRAYQTTLDLRDIVGNYTIAAVVSLHLSSHGNGIGGFHEGWMYQLKPNINRTGIYSEISDVFYKSSERSSAAYKYVDTLRSTKIRSWDSWFLGKAFHGGEVSSMAGLLGITLATTGDARSLWSTPWDTAEQIDWDNVYLQSDLVQNMIFDASHATALSSGKLPRKGFSSVSARANLMLQGELFATYPAQDTVIMAYQGKGVYYAMVDASGTFRVRGVADYKNVVDKLIIEGYRFDEKSGKVVWAIDKKETGKNNYRVKMRRQSMKTDLTLFSCRETTIFSLLEPRNFKYLTKIKLLDGRRDAPPQRYWWSRIDTRSSTIASIYTEPGTWLKLTLSDTVLTRKIILSNSSEKNPLGFGYPVNDYQKIPNTTYHAAEDLWAILQPRVENLEKHGIVDTQINRLQKQGLEAMEESRQALAAADYGEFKSATLRAMALAGRVYVQVEKTQKDVLFGVLFYIALFVPFAFCMERFLFNYANIYKRISAFTLLLLGLITVIYNVHPAFQLAYSPTVVILAFFIIGLSAMVSLIIFFRFEEEMILMQRRASHKRPSEISHWKAFIAAFFLGVSNLRRRRLRTTLTCLTLIILTFTIMSFTTVKSTQKPSRLLFQQSAPYNGILLKAINWMSLPREAASIIMGKLEEEKVAAPRVWLEGKNQTRPTLVPLSYEKTHLELSGLIGLSDNEPNITGMDKILTAGRWFSHGENNTIILSSQTAKQLGISEKDIGRKVSLWGMEVILIGLFNGDLFNEITDLDGEPLSPVFFPQEISAELNEAEQEAIESSDDVRSMQSRYQHVDGSQVAIIPARTLFAIGGELKSAALKPSDPSVIPQIGESLVERYSLPIFVGEDSGVWFYSPSTKLSYKGVPNIMIPLLISVLIVLNTMISSVYERKNEIAVYTSVGLAPSHVSFLFIAEAMALAVISVVLGYLMAQVSAALFSTTSYWQGITVNYSSMAGVAAMLLVIAVVLISVIYPSHVAGKIAIPDVNMSFSLPKPVNNKIIVMLPFFMKYEEHESIGGFIHSYLAGHQDISHGLFSTGPVEVVYSCSTVGEIQQMILRADDPSSLHCTHLHAKVWLAPFDFGIMQRVDIQFCPARENSNYLEIKITLERQSGEVSMWQRVNTLFIHDIRKQLLIWRSIDDEGHAEYQQNLRRILLIQDTPNSAVSG